MKHLIFSIVIWLVVFLTSYAQSPEKISYQAVIRNSDSQLVPNQQIGMQISILQGSIYGSAVYVEKQTPQSNSNGLVSIEIGGDSAIVLNGDLSLIDWKNGPYFIKTELDISGGSNYTISGIQELISVPYALYANKAGELAGELPEVDPQLMSSVASKITAEDTVNWNNKLDGFTETQTLEDVASLGNSVNAQLKDVAQPTDENDAATKIYVDKLMNSLLSKGIIVKDIDGNIYSTVRIGSQIWMAENLKVTHLSDGTAIPLVTDQEDWSSLAEMGYCWFNNDSASNFKEFGALYNWHSVETERVCPTGWRVPTLADFEMLESFLIAHLYNYDGTTSEDKTAKSLASKLYWETVPNEGAVGNDKTKNNSSGFDAKPAGVRTVDFYVNKSSMTDYWTQDIFGPSEAVHMRLNASGFEFYLLHSPRTFGSSIRCLKDD